MRPPPYQNLPTRGAIRFNLDPSVDARVPDVHFNWTFATYIFVAEIQSSNLANSRVLDLSSPKVYFKALRANPVVR